MEPRIVVSSALVGFASGLRSTMGIAAFAHTRFGGTWLGALAGLAIVGESVVDKLPSTPSRLAMPGLLARPAAGGLGAYALAGRQDAAGTVTAVSVGSIAALVGSYAGAAYRSTASQRVPPVAAALAEDAAALGLAYGAVAHSHPAL